MRLGKSDRLAGLSEVFKLDLAHLPIVGMSPRSGHGLRFDRCGFV